MNLSSILQNVGYIYLALIIFVDVAMMYFLSLSDGFANKHAALISLLLYAITFIFAGLALKHLSAGIVYALWGGIGTVGCVLVSHFLLGQQLDAPAYIGIVFIITGVMIIELFSKAVI